MQLWFAHPYLVLCDLCAFYVFYSINVLGLVRSDGIEQGNLPIYAFTDDLILCWQLLNRNLDSMKNNKVLRSNVS